MTERRPHWDDDLIDAVNGAMENNAYHDEMVYAVIAAVEDWQDANGFSRAGALMHRDGLTPEQAADKLTRLTEDVGLYEDGAT